MPLRPCLACARADGPSKPWRLCPGIVFAQNFSAKMFSAFCEMAEGRMFLSWYLWDGLVARAKSFLLAPLRALYGPGHVQSTPQRGNFPLLGLETKKVVLLDDWCFDDTILPLPTQLLWYEGKPFPLPRPQNSSHYQGHLLYEGTAPIFVTVKGERSWTVSHQSSRMCRTAIANALHV